MKHQEDNLILGGGDYNFHISDQMLLQEHGYFYAKYLSSSGNIANVERKLINNT